MASRDSVPIQGALRAPPVAGGYDTSTHTPSLVPPNITIGKLLYLPTVLLGSINCFGSVQNKQANLLSFQQWKLILRRQWGKVF